MDGGCPPSCRGMPLTIGEEREASRLVSKILDETKSRAERAEILEQLLSYYKVNEAKG